MTNLTTFSFHANNDDTTTEQPVRVIDQNGEPWFVLRDVLKAMGTSVRTNAAKGDIEQGLGKGCINDTPLQTAGGTQTVTIISEPAVTFLVSRSNTETGRRLNQWIHTEVIPSIRKTGSYSVQPTPAAIPQIELEERTVALVEQTYDLAERCHDSVLKVMLLDKCKNMLGAGNDPALPSASSGYFQVYQILESLGCSQREIRHIGSSAGKRVAAAYRRLTGQEPETVERIVDGAARQVKVYPASFREDAEAMLSQYLGADAA